MNEDEIEDAMNFFGAGGDDDDSSGGGGGNDYANDYARRPMSSLIAFGTGWILSL